MLESIKVTTVNSGEKNLARTVSKRAALTSGPVQTDICFEGMMGLVMKL